jgi:hypothetical protein
MLTKIACVGEIAVMGYRNRPARIVDCKRLRVSNVAIPGRRVSNVSNGRMPGQALKIGLGKSVGHMAQVPMNEHLSSIGGNDPGGLLTSMLKSMKT